MWVIDNKRSIKNFIDYICEWVEHEYRINSNDRFCYELRNNKMSYLVADKGIEKRIQKQLFKRLNIESLVKYELSPSLNRYWDGIITIKLIYHKDKLI